MKKIIKKLKGSPFAAFASKKVIFLIIAIFIAMNLLFIFTHLMPSNPAEIMAGKVGSISGISGQGPTMPGQASKHEILRRIYLVKFGVTKPIHEQYATFWGRFLTMDYGYSFWHYPHSVASLVMHALPWTMALVIPVIPLGFVIGNWIGSRAAYRRGRFDRLLYYFSMYLSKAPYFWIALLLMLVFGTWLGWFPIGGAFGKQFIRPSFTLDWFLSALYHWALPFISLVGLGIGGWAIGMRAMVVYEMESDYMHYSEQLGFSRGKLRSYAERNAILPNFTWIPVTLNMLIGQTLLVEYVFGYRGIGNLFYIATLNQDYPLLEACFVVTLLVVLMGNFVADLLYAKLDPRIAKGYVGEH